ncbi:Putative glutathione transporter, permease component [Hyphomicrobiales bacterium]|nr:Putative glutathione transporter, permease component [Hyphomicrobiales bacterium]CAH1691974.1 putative glutathione transporter, permease component [Hyphomicrobiales bacterium]
MRLIISRLVSVVPVVCLITIFAFLVVDLVPGNVVYAIVGDDADQATIDRITEALRLNDPVLTRYLNWVGGMLQGDFGRSLYGGESVGNMIAQRLPTTLSLTVFAIVFGIIIGVPLGILSGTTRSAAADRLTTIAITLAISVPNYVFALLFALVMALNLRLFPTTGYAPLMTDPAGWLYHLILPALALSFAPAAVVARQLRGALKEVLRSDYIRAARAKGLRSGAVLFRHALRNAAGPALTALGIQVAHLLGGAVAIEQVFALPGLGQLAINAVSTRDFTVIQSVVVVGALAVVGVNLIVDVIYMMLNPKVSMDG